MSEKLLTVSVAGYNVERFIRECLDSCLISDMNALEVIVVDDGGSDATLEIAQEYADRYPGVFRPVHKENGGYGTTVNTSLSLAQGKYFRPLDGDDWFDADGLAALLRATESNADVLIFPYVRELGVESRVMDQAAEECSGLMPFEEAQIPWRLGMHAVAYRTELLRDSGLELPGRMLYTDVLYAVKPLSLVKTAWVGHSPVYRYRLGVEGQSVSVDTLLKHREERIRIIDMLAQIRSELPSGCDLAEHILSAWIVDYATWHIQMLFRQQPTDEYWDEIVYLRSLLEREGLSEVARSASKSYGLLSHAGRRSYPAISWLYRRFKGNKYYSV